MVPGGVESRLQSAQRSAPSGRSLSAFVLIFVLFWILFGFVFEQSHHLSPGSSFLFTASSDELQVS